MTELEQMINQMKLIFDVMKDDSFVDSVASFCWNLNKKLKSKGFTDEQAMQIVSAMSRPK